VNGQARREQNQQEKVLHVKIKEVIYQNKIYEKECQSRIKGNAQIKKHNCKCKCHRGGCGEQGGGGDENQPPRSLNSYPFSFS